MLPLLVRIARVLVTCISWSAMANAKTVIAAVPHAVAAHSTTAPAARPLEFSWLASADSSVHLSIRTPQVITPAFPASPAVSLVA